MNKLWQGGVLVALAVVFAVALSALLGTRQEALGQPGGGVKSGGPHYTVIETNGQNLLVADNVANKLYYYTIGKDQPIGSPLKLRASLDLTQVGKEQIKITPTRWRSSTRGRSRSMPQRGARRREPGAPCGPFRRRSFDEPYDEEPGGLAVLVGLLHAGSALAQGVRGRRLQPVHGHFRPGGGGLQPVHGRACHGGSRL